MYIHCPLHGYQIKSSLWYGSPLKQSPPKTFIWLGVFFGLNMVACILFKKGTQPRQPKASMTFASRFFRWKAEVSCLCCFYLVILIKKQNIAFLLCTTIILKTQHYCGVIMCVLSSFALIVRGDPSCLIAFRKSKEDDSFKTSNFQEVQD